MSVLSWDKPAKIMSIEEWKGISADGAPPGVYVSNMSEEDRKRWKAKLCGQKSENLKDLRVEIRVVRHANILIKVYRGGIAVSSNSAFIFTNDDLRDFYAAIEEARAKINEYVTSQENP